MRRSSSPGRFCLALALAAALLALVAGQAQAAVVPTFVGVTQAATVTEPNCANPPPLPGGAGAFSVTTTAPSQTTVTSWSVTAQITAGATATLRLQPGSGGDRGCGA